MEITQSIVKSGTEAVLLYRTISERPDNELPEVFLGGYMAPRLHDEFRYPVHVEYDYLLIMSRSGIAVTQDAVSKVGHFRADVAMCPAGSPPVIIEFKIFDERTRATSIQDDAHKIEKLSSLCPVAGYVAALVCETRNSTLEERVGQVQQALGRKLYTGEPQKSADGYWNWCFASAAL